MHSKKERKTPPPLDAASLESLALRYVERFATSEAKLTRYLFRKVRERGWIGESAVDCASIVQRLAELRYVDDRGFGESRSRGLQRKGFGPRRIGQELRAAGIADEIRTEIVDEVDGRAAALAFARRKRMGPFAPEPPTREVRARHFAAMLRAGHDFRLAAEILDAAEETDLYEE